MSVKDEPERGRQREREKKKVENRQNWINVKGERAEAVSDLGDVLEARQRIP